MIIKLNDGITFEITNFVDRTRFGEDGDVLRILSFEILDEVSQESLMDAFTKKNLSRLFIIPNRQKEQVFTDKELESVDFRITEFNIRRTVTLR